MLCPDEKDDMSFGENVYSTICLKISPNGWFVLVTEPRKRFLENLSWKTIYEFDHYIYNIKLLLSNFLVLKCVFILHQLFVSEINIESRSQWRHT